MSLSGTTTFNSNPRKSGGAGIDYAKLINETNQKLITETTILTNRITYIKDYYASLYYTTSGFDAGVDYTIGGTNPPGASNIFTSTNKPSSKITGSSDDWLTELTSTNNPLFGALKYRGSQPRNVKATVSVTLTSPDAGGSVGYDLSVLIYVNGTPINSVNGDGVTLSPDGLQLLIAVNPNDKITTGERTYSFDINQGDIITAKIQCNNGASVGSFVMYQAKLNIAYQYTNYTG